MVRLRVCPCFRLSEYDEFMEPVANRPWDAWHVVNDEKRFIINYVSDGFYNYLKHLLHSPMCREYTGLNFSHSFRMAFSVGGVKTALYLARVHQPTRVTEGEPNGRKP